MSTPSDTPQTPEQISREISQLAKMREQIHADMEAMRVQEGNLRAFEARIRGSMPPMSTGSRASFDSKSPINLDAEWEKFQRSRALLEAERRALTDERLVIREEREILRQREEGLKQRESWVEVTDSGGHILLSSLQPAGARQDVNGRAPLTIVIGNAPGVHVEYGGKSVDLAPYTRGHVARLALN